MRVFSATCWLIIAILTMSLFFVPTIDVTAQESDDLKWQLKKMEEMMQKQQGMIDNLKTKMEIQQGLLEKYLGPVEVGYKKGFYFRTRDDKFLMRMTGRIQMRYGYEDRDDEDWRSSLIPLSLPASKPARLTITNTLEVSVQKRLN